MVLGPYCHPAIDTEFISIGENDPYLCAKCENNWSTVYCIPKKRYFSNKFNRTKKCKDFKEKNHLR
ncbi:MAG: hypothetical protein ACFFC7_34195 [Candidatus Hermodarchaeota archaeon]